MTTESILLAGMSILGTAIAHLYHERSKDAKRAEEKAEARHVASNLHWETQFTAAGVESKELRRRVDLCESEREKLTIQLAVVRTGCIKPDCVLRKGN